MSKKFVKYCLLLNIIFISPINHLQAMNKDEIGRKNTRVVVYSRNQVLSERQEKEAALKAQQEKEAIAREKEKRETMQKIHENRIKVRDCIKTAEQKLADGEDKVIEDYIGKLEDAIRGQFVEKGEINSIWTDAQFLLAEKDNPDNNARGVILSLALARYYGAACGDIDSTITYLKLAAKYDTDTAKFCEILQGIKLKKSQESRIAQEKAEAITRQTQAGIEAEMQEATKRGIFIGAGGVAALALTWWGYSYIFGK